MERLHHEKVVLGLNCIFHLRFFVFVENTAKRDLFWNTYLESFRLRLFFEWSEATAVDEVFRLYI